MSCRTVLYCILYCTWRSSRKTLSLMPLTQSGDHFMQSVCVTFTKLMLRPHEGHVPVEQTVLSILLVNGDQEETTGKPLKCTCPLLRHWIAAWLGIMLPHTRWYSTSQHRALRGCGQVTVALACPHCFLGTGWSGTTVYPAPSARWACASHVDGA